ncbi:MAG: ATP-binding protein [Phycisphaeraceae bacterium]
MAQPQPQKMVIPSKPSQAPAVTEAILAQVQAQGYSEHARFAVRLALDEALSNAIRHGNCGDESKRITITYQVTAEECRITICDEGCGFHPECLPDPTKPEFIERPCGRGVMLMRAYMTEVTFNPQGNCVTMLKRRDCPLPRL